MFLKKRKPAILPSAPLPSVPAPALKQNGGDPDKMNGLALAYVGDAVYGLMVRHYVTARCGGTVKELHRQTVDLCNAAFQSRAAAAVEPLLTEAETSVFRRGRNAHPGHVPKNKTPADYHLATALEALFGWLYLKNETARLQTLFQTITEIKEASDHGKKN